MKVGTVCYATWRGLGQLALAFYKNGIVTDPMVLHHGTYTTHHEWYPGCVQITTRPFLGREVKKKIEEVDVMVFFETPFDWEIIRYCKEVGTKTAILTMYECTPEKIPYIPDLFLCPSLLDLEYFPTGTYIPPPVDPAPWRQRTVALKYVHNGGDLGLRGRNSTREVLEAMRYVKSPLSITIRSQNKVEFGKLLRAASWIGRDSRVVVEVGNQPRERLWDEYDVCVAPERNNGMSLPLNEACSHGLLVMSTDRFPMNTWLRKEPLIPVARFDTARIGGCMRFQEATLSPRTIATVMDEWYGKDISEYSLYGKEWAEKNSWAVLGPKYQQALEELVNG